MWTVALLALTVILRVCSSSRVGLPPGIPIAGKRSFLEPTWLLRLRFIRGARHIIQCGYRQYRDIFVVHRLGADIVVIGDQKFLEEIRTQTRDSARSVQPFLNDFHSRYTKGQVFGDSDLQNRVLQQRLTPHIPRLIPTMVNEGFTALQRETNLAASTEWNELDPTTIFPRIAASIVSRIWLGDAGKYNEQWVDIGANYTRSVFLTGFMLRFVPQIFRPLIVWTIPQYRTLRKSIRDARRVIAALIQERATANKEDFNDVLQWMLDMGSGNELDVDNLAQRILILSLSGIHTTALTIAQALYDICASPGQLETLREEIAMVLGPMESWDRASLAKLDKMDSLIKESQRRNPVFLLTFQRILPCDVALSNGLNLPAGTRIAVPQHAIANDAALIPGGEPDSYKPWRYAQLRAESENENKYHFAMVDSSHMAFGFGKYACPGRFFVSNEIKIILAQMLLEYDLDLTAGSSRPKNFTIDADMYPDRKARLRIRRRVASSQQ
ncbi:Ent-kaurene oxidase [Pseudocercospora fuligena]|uniref:Ent-kaurene oxidase n=1 Tax=Pseudocercospora fuligena TaxID=685502 RepID=A0A8H6VL44_9PEZI|nr:Ent-kaurene oxidase [Pseudocercospora fuligena]